MKNVLILSHYYARAEASGPPQDLRDFLLDKADTVAYIEHPFPYNKRLNEDTRSMLTVYENGKLKKQSRLPTWRGPEASAYIKDIFATFWFLLLLRRRFDLCVALDNLNTFSVLPWRKLRIIKTLVYYTIDYTPARFTNKRLNSIYHWIDRVCCYNADAIWNLAPRIMEGRYGNGVDEKRCAPSILVPMGAHLDLINRLPVEEVSRHKLAFVGHLVEGHGLQLVLRTLPKLKEKVPDVSLVVIGKGEYEPDLKRMAAELGVVDIVDFKGFVRDHRELERELCQCAVGLAPYVPEEGTITFYTDPGKPKLYVGCGLPVVITKVPAIAAEIEAAGAGLAIEYSEKDLLKALTRLLTDDAFFRGARQNASEFAKRFDTDAILGEALEETIRLSTKGKSIFYANYAPYGNSGNILDYLKEAYPTLVYVSFVFHQIARSEKNRVEIYKNGILVKKIPLLTIRAPRKHVHALAPLLSIITVLEMFSAAVWVRLRYRIKPRIFFASNALLVQTGLVLRRLALVDKVVFWVWDYYPTRQQGGLRSLVNKMYWALDKNASEHADYDWYISERLREIRIERGVRVNENRQIVASLGIDVIGKIKKPAKPIVGFLGVLKKEQGLEVLLDSVDDLVAEYPDITIEVIGSGPDEGYFKTLASAKEHGDKVRFIGYIADEDEVKERIAGWSAAYAMYIPSEENVSQYADPSKVRLYLGCGVPVIMTDVPLLAAEIRQNSAGFVIPYDAADLVAATVSTLSENETYRRNSLNMAEKYGFKELYDGVFKSIDNQLWPENQ